MNKLAAILLACITFTASLSAQNAGEVTKLLKRLQSDDIETRHGAMFDLQTSLDPRIPDACLPVLEKEGDSIRRLAARAIGSRWHQIPKERVPLFTAALKARLGDGSVKNMARRGIALLNRDFQSPMVSQSESKRWVLYERFGLPCIIDTQSMTEELLGPLNGSKMTCAYGNEELLPTVRWHPSQDMVAMSIIEDRHFRNVWAWIHRKGLRRFTRGELIGALGAKEADLGIGFYADIAGWTGNDLDISLSYSLRKGEAFTEHDAKVRWKSSTDKFAVLSDKIAN